MNKKEFILCLVDIIFTTILFLVFACVSVFGGFALASSYKPIDNLENESCFSSIQNKSVDTLSAVSPADTVTSDYTYYGASFPLCVGFYNNLGFDYDYGGDVVVDVLDSTLNKAMFIPFRFYFNRSSVNSNSSSRYIGFDTYYLDTDTSNFHNIINLSTFTIEFT